MSYNHPKTIIRISHTAKILKNKIELFIAEFRNNPVFVGLYQETNNNNNITRLTANKQGNAEGSRTIA
jgi:hypothetical protein